MRVYKIKSNFIYPEISETDYRFGSSPLVGEELRADGDWRDYLPPEEDQNIRGIESSACYIEAQQHSIATIEEETFNEIDNNYSARFNALLSGGTPSGGDPLKGAKSIRNDGLVKDKSMSFNDDVQSWEDFHSWKGVNEATIRAEGIKDISINNRGYEITFDRNESVQSKYLKLRQVLKYCPPAVSVSAWFEEKGVFVKPEGMRDNHLTLLVFIDDKNRPYFWDTYDPHLKIGQPFYNFDFGIRWTVSKNKQETLNWIEIMLKWIREQLGIIQKQVDELPKPEPKPEPIKTPQERLLDISYESLGKDLTPDDVVPDEVACATQFCAVVRKIHPDFPDVPYTTNLLTFLKNDSRFKATLNIEQGNVMLSITDDNYKNVPMRGHVVIVAKDGVCHSNDSSSPTKGQWSENFTVDSFVKRYRDTGGKKIYVFQPI